jgi:hypothetical protein
LTPAFTLTKICKTTQNHHPEDRSSFYRCPVR